MEWINYHHLLYFYVTAREGSVTRAARQLHLTQPTVSGQLQSLERMLGQPLFERVGRKLSLTPAGKVVYRYAEEIFSLGQEMVSVVKGRMSETLPRFSIGVVDSLPKVLVYRLIEPLLVRPDPVRVLCREGDYEDLLVRLASHAYDLVLTDSPVSPSLKLRVHHHRLGSSGISFLAAPALARRLQGGFPASLHKAPVLLPCQDTSLRRELQQWLFAKDIHPQLLAEVDDSALMMAMGREGVGIFPAPSISAEEIMRLLGVVLVGETSEITQGVYMITAERRFKNPWLRSIAERGKKLFLA